MKIRTEDFEVNHKINYRTGQLRQGLVTGMTVCALMLSGLLMTSSAGAAISLDRTRVIFNGNEQSTTLSISNQNKELPYLAQAWLENAQGNKIDSPLTALPPLQRIEAGTKSQVKVQITQGIDKLPQDKETLFYFNLREIPPKANKPNTLQIALQTRIKLFYRPKAIAITRADQSNPYQQKLTLMRQGDHFVASNPTPYYITLAKASTTLKGDAVKGFEPMMIPPKGNATLGGSASVLGNAPVLTYINDYGGRPQMMFVCKGDICSVKRVTAG